MHITYRDEIGLVSVEVDDSIAFTDGIAYFESDGKRCKVGVENIMIIEE